MNDVDLEYELTVSIYKKVWHSVEGDAYVAAYDSMDHDIFQFVYGNTRDKVISSERYTENHLTTAINNRLTQAK